MKLEINNRRKTGKLINMWTLKNMLLNNQWVKDKIKTEILKYLQTIESGNTTYQNLRDAAKGVLRGQFKAINAYITKKKRSQIIHLNLHLREPEKEEQTKAKLSQNNYTQTKSKVSSMHNRSTRRMGVGRREKRAEKILKEIRAEDFSNLLKDNNLHSQEALRSPSRIHP